MPDTQPDSLSAGRSQASDLYVVVLRSWWIVIACAAVAGAVGYQYAKGRPASYDAVSSIYFKPTSVATQVVGAGLPGAQDADRRAQTNTDLMLLPAVSTRAAVSLGEKWTTADVQRSFEVATGGQSDIVKITATSGDPAEAADIADAVATAAIKYRADSNRRDLVQADRIVRRQVSKLSARQRRLDSNQALLARAQQLKLLVAAPATDAVIVQRARVPTASTTPGPARGGLLGVILGGLIGVVLAYLRSRIDRRVRDQKRLLANWDLPVLAVLPKSKAFGRGVGMSPSDPDLELLASARTSVRFMARDAPSAVLAVVSAVDGEGKTTVCWNMSAAVAATGARVLLVEGDLREPSVVKKRGVSPSPGLAGFIAGNSTLDDSIRPAALADDVSFDVLPAGNAPNLPLAQLTQADLSGLFAEARKRYDLVVVDTAPLTLVPDALVLADYADGLLAVARLGVVTEDEFRRLASLLEPIPTPKYGLIVNGGRRQRRRAYGTGRRAVNA